MRERPCLFSTFVVVLETASAGESSQDPNHETSQRATNHVIDHSAITGIILNKLLMQTFN